MLIRTKEEAIAFRKQIEAACLNLDDRGASMSTELFGGMRLDGGLIKAGTRIKFEGALYKAAVDLWDREDCTPTAAPTIWEKLNYHSGVRVIPEVITVTTAFAKGEEGFWEKDGCIYISKVDNNVYTPETYAPNWEKKEE